ncbi:MAG: Aspartyl/glutamyl-tRNA(Asn/Gln) amidotransferase subunit C [Parcubacteria group bacterium GW2011_GWA2_45_30]|nr:MAG: Aspartyl/glutamyl-tRNA(Asn/Gln) amidotransferase subunit C [Parcubacteria group bacterium GW2011_GWA2_45_30]
MSINIKDVQHIAHLARIELTPEEETKFEKELSAILGFVEKLNEVDTENVQPLTGGTLLENVMRKDEQIDNDLQGKEAALLDAAPEKERGYVRVKAVFE